MIKENTGGITVSQVGMFVRNDLAVLCGETIFCNDSGTKQTIHKVHCSDNAILIGFTGRLESCLEFFDGFIKSSNGNLHIDNELITKLSFVGFSKIIDKRFVGMVGKKLPTEFDTAFVIAGYDDERIIGRAYRISANVLERRELSSNDSSFAYHLQGIISTDAQFVVETLYDDCIKNITYSFQNKLDELIKTSSELNNIMKAYVIAIHKGEIIWWKVE